MFHSGHHWNVSVILEFLRTFPSDNKLSFRLLPGILVILVILDKEDKLCIIKLADVKITQEHVTGSNNWSVKTVSTNKTSGCNENGWAF